MYSLSPVTLGGAFDTGKVNDTVVLLKLNSVMGVTKAGESNN